MKKINARKRAAKLLASQSPAHVEVTAPAPIDHSYKMFLEGNGAKVTIEGNKFQVAVLAQRILK